MSPALHFGACAAAVSLLGGCYALLEGQPVEPQPAPARVATPGPAGAKGVPPASSPAAKAAKPSTVAARDTPAPRRIGDERPATYVVRRGDTLFAIALEFGLDYRDVARWNELATPDRIVVGQVLRLQPPDGADAPVIRAATATEDVRAEPLSPVAEPASADTPPADERTPAASPPPSASPAAPIPVLSEPQAQVLPYSEKAWSQLGGAAQNPDQPAVPPTVEKTAVRAVPQAANAPQGADAKAGDDIEWAWPASGSIVYRFGESGARKGVGIAGNLGQPVNAAAPGKVVYSGSGLRGYGKLVILKHNETYFSVYAHNNALLVKEGEQVKRGQKIAEMGNSEATQVALHFEIRRFGQPVDPLNGLLPPR